MISRQPATINQQGRVRYPISNQLDRYIDKCMYCTLFTSADSRQPATITQQGVSFSVFYYVLNIVLFV